MTYSHAALGLLLVVLTAWRIVVWRRRAVKVAGFTHEQLKRWLEQHEKEHPNG